MQRLIALAAILALALPQTACLFRAHVRPGYQRAGLAERCKHGESSDGHRCRHDNRGHKGGGHGRDGDEHDHDH